MQNFKTVVQTLLGEKYVTWKERKKNNAKNIEHYDPAARAPHPIHLDQLLQIHCRTHSSIQSLPVNTKPKILSEGRQSIITLIRGSHLAAFRVNKGFGKLTNVGLICEVQII